MYRLATWNVNGLRACAQKGFLDWANSGVQIIMLQETKATREQLPHGVLELENDFHCHYSSSQEKKGYSGVALYSHKKLPMPEITVGLGIAKFDQEGRTLIAEYPDFIAIGAYFPNGGRELERVPFKLEFSRAIARTAMVLMKKKKKPVVIGGDYNTANREIDLANAQANVGNTGFLPIERAWLDEFIGQGFLDLYRQKYPDKKDIYSWWTYRNNCRERNIGWRLDYFFAPKEVLPHIKKIYYQPEIMGSDHCPLILELDF
ncbi:MAG: exodeoxyribonuclease III [Pseudomonadota bacterium]